MSASCSGHVYAENLRGSSCEGRIDIRASVTENLKNVADAMGREVSDLTMVILDRERHEKIIREARKPGPAYT